MGRYITAEVTTEVDVDLDDLDIDDLIEYLEEQGYEVYSDGSFNDNPTRETSEARQLLTTIYHKRRCNIAVEKELDRLIYVVLGRII